MSHEAPRSLTERVLDGRRARIGVALVAALLGVHAGTARAAAGQTCDASAYRLSLQSLTTPPRADLTIRITTATLECALPEALSDAQVTIFPRRGHSQRRLEVRDVASPGGTATVR